jgi:hypothetical protein
VDNCGIVELADEKANISKYEEYPYSAKCPALHQRIPLCRCQKYQIEEDEVCCDDQRLHQIAIFIILSHSPKN